MKKIFFVLLLSLPTWAASLSENIYFNEKSGFEVTDEQVSTLKESVFPLINLNSQVVEQGLPLTPARLLSKWKSSGYVTSIGVTSSGKLGLLGFKGSAMAEIYWWEKKSLRPSMLQNQIQEPADVELSDLSETGINESLEHLMAIIKGSQKVNNPENAREELRQKLTEFANLVRGTSVDPNQPWFLSGIRLDLAVSGTGNLTPVYTLGIALSLRVVWVPVKAKTPTPFRLNEGRSALSDMTEDLTRVLAEIPENQNLESKGLNLKQIRFGLGLTAAGKVAFGKMDGSLVFSVLMNKNPKYVPPPQVLKTAMRSPTLLIANESEIEKIDWKLFKKGITKALRLSHSFIDKNVDEEKEKTNKWEINTIKTSYSLNLSKGVGLITVGEVAQLQMTYKK